MKEDLVKKQVKQILDAAGAYWFMPPANGFGRAGIHDFVGCLNGQYIGIECKGTDGRWTALQQREHERVLAHGGFSMCVTPDNINELKKELAKWTKKNSSAA